MNDACHAKTGLMIFVIVIPKEVLAGVIPKEGLAGTNLAMLSFSMIATMKYNL